MYRTSLVCNGDMYILAIGSWIDLSPLALPSSIDCTRTRFASPFLVTALSDQCHGHRGGLVDSLTLMMSRVCAGLGMD